MCAAGCDRHRVGATHASPCRGFWSAEGDACVAPTRRLVIGRVDDVLQPMKYLVAVGVVGAVLGLTACSPEDGRKIGERGADTGNRPERSADVELHGKQDPDHNVPNRLAPPEQTGRQ